MDILNNQFIVHQLMKQNNSTYTYIVTDLKDEHRTLQLQTFRADLLPSDLMDYYKENFLQLKQLSNTYIQKNHHFNSIRYYDHQTQPEEWYFFTSEYIESSTPLLRYIASLSLEESMKVYIEMCRAIHYLHVKNIVYGAVHPSNIYMINDQVKLKDLASVAMEKYDLHGDTSMTEFYQSPYILAGEKESFSSDIYSLGVLLLTFLSKEEVTCNPLEYAQALRTSPTFHESYHDEFAFVDQLLNLAEKMLDMSSDASYEKVTEVAAVIYALCKQETPFIQVEELETLNERTEIVGRDLEVKQVLHHYEQMLAFKPSKKIFYIQGNRGTGKTRMLEELKFLFELQKGHVYASIGSKQHGKSDKEMWMQLLTELLDTSDGIIREKYREKLNIYFPELKNEMASTAPYEVWTELNTRSQILHAIVRFLSETSENRSIVLMIDDIDKASQFTLDILFQLSINVANQNNIFLIFSGTEEASIMNQYAKDFLHRVKQLDISETIFIQALDLAASTKMIQHIFSARKKPNIAKQIFEKSYGNPLFIHEIMKDLYIRQIIYINPETGEWNIHLPEKSNYSSLTIPENMEQAMLNQLQGVAAEGKKVLQKLSIFNEPVSQAELQLIYSLDIVELSETLAHLLALQLVVEIDYQEIKLYDFYNQTLKSVVYDKISLSKKQEWHEQAISYFRQQANGNNPLELQRIIYHANQTDDRDTLIHTHRQYVKIMEKHRNMKEQIVHLQYIYHLLDHPAERAILLVEIGSLYAEIGNPVKAIHSFEEAEEAILATKDPKHIISIYMNLANVYAFNTDTHHTKFYLQKVKEQLVHLEKPSEELLVEYDRIDAIAEIGAGHFDNGIAILNDVIYRAGSHLLRTKGDALRTLAYVYIVMNQSDKALHLLEEALTILEKENYPRGILLTLNNIGVIHSYDQPKKAIYYFEKVRDLSEAYGNTISEIYALTNISVIHQREYRLREAHQYGMNALQLAEKHHISDRIYYTYTLLIPLYIQMNDYKKALEYYDLLKIGVEQKIPGLLQSNYHMLSVNLWMELGEFEKAQGFRETILQENVKRDKVNEAVVSLYEHIQTLKQLDKGQEAEVVQKLKEYEEQLPQIVEVSSLAALTIQLMEVIHEKELQVDLEELQKTVLMKLEKELAPDLQAQKYYLHALFANEEERQAYLVKSILYAQQLENKSFLAKLNIVLGKYYEKKAKSYDAITCYLESWYHTKNQLTKVPQTYHLSYLYGNGLFAGFQRLVDLYQRMFAKNLLPHDWSQTRLTSEKLAAICELPLIERFINETSYIRHIHEESIEQQTIKLRHITDVIQHITGDSQEDLKMILQYLAAITVADNVMVITENNINSLQVLAANNAYKVLPPYTHLLQRVRKTKEAILLSNHMDSPYNQMVKGENFSAVICVPIIKQSSRDDKYAVDHFLGYLYLETNKMVNRFDEAGLHECIQLTNYLTLLLEKIQLERSASIDKMTGTLTRKYVEDKLHEIVSVSFQNDLTFSIAMFDLDHFKQVNDQYGHQMGDHVLTEVCQTAKGLLGHAEVIGRYGGEEFLLIFPETNQEEAFVKTELIRKEIEKIRPITDAEKITISCGIATYPEHGMSSMKLIERVDQALYVAKDAGRNQTAIWQEGYVQREDMTDKLSGLIGGDGTTDYRNLTILIDLIQLTNTKEAFTQKIYIYLSKVMELIEAEYGFLLLLDGGKVTQSYGRKVQLDDWLVDQSLLEDKIIQKVLETKRNHFTMNWHDANKEQMPNDLYSVLAAPIARDDKVIAILYFATAGNKKIFGLNESNAVSIYKEIALNLMRQQQDIPSSP